MPRTNALPKYRKHRASGQAVVTSAARFLPRPARHQDVQARIRPADCRVAAARSDGPTQSARQYGDYRPGCYLKYAKTYYRKNGKETREVGCLTDALRFVRELYGKTPADEFGPVALQVVRGQMIAARLDAQIHQQASRAHRALFSLGRIPRNGFAHGAQGLPRSAVYTRAAPKRRTGRPSNRWPRTCIKPRCRTCHRSWPTWQGFNG